MFVNSSKCSICGTSNLKRVRSTKEDNFLSVSFSYEEIIDKCLTCDEAVYLEESDENYLMAFQLAKPKIVRMIIDHLATKNIFTGYIERVLGIHQRTIKTWSVVGCSDGELSLLKIIYLYPKLLMKLDNI